jgi:hypothetical protein
MIHTFLFYATTNIIVMYVMCRKKLELFRKTVTSDGQPQTEDGYEKDIVENC